MMLFWLESQRLSNTKRLRNDIDTVDAKIDQNHENQEARRGAGERVVFVVVVFFTLTDRASTIPSSIRGCQSDTWSAGQEIIRGTSTKLPRELENKTKQKQDKNDKKKATITQNTCHKKTGEGHSIKRVYYRASRELSDTLPGSQPYTQTHSIYNSVLSGLQFFLQAQSTSTSLRKSLGWSVSSLLDSPQARPQPCWPLPLLSSFAGVWTSFLFLHPRGHKPTAPFTYCAIPAPRVKCGSVPVPRDTKQPKILCHAVRPLSLLPPRPTFPRVLQLSRYDPLG